MELGKELINAIRFLSVDAVNAANSGHPGMPLGMAEVAAVLWFKHLKHDPNNPDWLDRDRFILSNGHGSMLLYSLLHLTGYNWTIEDLKQFRQLDSKTPGHPELMPGIETTTGPLGQGLANAVGMALAEKMLAKKYNQFVEIIDHYTYVFVGDGCLMEGVSHEAASFAGHHKLSKLIVFWDDNSITIDGNTNLSVSDDVLQRFGAYNWQVLSIDGHDPKAIDVAINSAKANKKQPTIIACKTQIGFASVLAGTAKIHGTPLGFENTKTLRNDLAWQYSEFEIPEKIYQAWDAKVQGKIAFDSWSLKLEKLKQHDVYKEFIAQMNPNIDLSKELEIAIKDFHSDMATRKASACFLSKFANKLPALIGGSADLTPSVLTDWPEAKERHINYGVREFGMFAIMSGLSLHKGFIPFGGTFLTFIDYGRSAIRMAAMMQLKQIYVLTHDSIGLGEDGPTHQPIEHLSILRATPGIETWRPCDTWETFVAWSEALAADNPSALVLTRQTVPNITRHDANKVAQGAYICLHADIPINKLHAIFMATGSEVHIAIESAIALAHEGIMVRVVSIPCLERFMAQPENIRLEILPSLVTRRLAIEAGVAQPWWRLVGDRGKVISIDCYGKSAPASTVFSEFGFTKERIIQTLNTMMEDE